MTSKPFNPMQVALSALNESKEKHGSNDFVGKDQKGNYSEISETQKFLWVSGGRSNMGIPVDGWNSLHWYRYFSMHFRNVFGHSYTGTQKSDMAGLSAFLFKAQRDLGMSGTEIKDCFDWIAKNKMPMMKNQGKIYFIGFLKDHLNEFYNSKIFAMKHLDDKNQTKNRDLFIDIRDLRYSLKEFVYRDSDMNLSDFDERILIQLGIPVVMQYLVVQENMTDFDARKLVLKKIEDIINKDLSRGSSSPRFERIVKNSIDWEPYPWKDFSWRKIVDKAIVFLKINEKDWYRAEPPIINLKPAACLKILKSKKRK